MVRSGHQAPSHDDECSDAADLHGYRTLVHVLKLDLRERFDVNYPRGVVWLYTPSTYFDAAVPRPLCEMPPDIEEGDIWFCTVNIGVESPDNLHFYGWEKLAYKKRDGPYAAD